MRKFIIRLILHQTICKKIRFRKGITWSDITANKLSFRLNDSWIFDKKGQTLHIDDNWFLYALALANSAVVQLFSKVLNPTLS